MPQEKIKSPAYKDVSIRTTVGYLPHIINTNNAHTKELFENICVYTDSSQYVKIPVITKSLVKGNSGHFGNLYISGNVKFDSSVACKNDFLNISTNHNLSINRFNDKNIALDSSWTHDANSIYYNDSSSLGEKFKWMEDTFNEIIGEDYLTKDEMMAEFVKKTDVSVFNIAISNINTSLNSLKSDITTLESKIIEHLSDLYSNLDINKDLENYNENNEKNIEPMMFRMMRMSNNDEDVRDVYSELNTQENTSNDFVDVYNSISTFYTYPINLYTQVPSYSDKHYKSKADYNDIKNGIKFKYYNNNNSKYLKIDNELPVTINGNVGDEIDLIIDKKLDKDVNIKLSSNKNSYSYVLVANDDIALARITLICVDYSEHYGSVWYVKNYSGNIQLK